MAVLSALEKIASYFLTPTPAPEPAAATGPDPIPNPPAEPRTTPFEALAGRLGAHGVALEARGSESARLLATTGFMLGEHHDAIAPLLDAVLASPPGAAIRLDLGQHPAADIGVICQFGQTLARLGLLADYEYRRAPHYLLTATARDCPEGRRFLAEGWFPHYGRVAVLRRLGQPRPPYALDVRLRLPEGPAIDLDLLALKDRLYAVRFGCEALADVLADLRRVALALPGLDPWLGLVLPRVAARDEPLLVEYFEVAVCDRKGMDLWLDQLPGTVAPPPTGTVPADTVF